MNTFTGMNRKLLHGGFAALCGMSILLGTTQVVARPGDPDPRFGNAGTLVTEYAGGGAGFTRLKDGKLLFRGLNVTRYPQVEPGGYVTPLELVKVDERGKLDTSFGQGGIVRIVNPATGAELSPEGPGELLTMTFLYWSLSNFHAFRELPDGSLLLVASDGDGKKRLVRLLANGSLDASYGKSGILELPSSKAYPFFSFLNLAVAIAADGTAYVLGAVQYPTGALLPELKRINPQGQVDDAYTLESMAALQKVALSNQDAAATLNVNAAGEAIVGTFRSAIRLTPEGKRDMGFGTAGSFETTIFGAGTGQYLFQRDGSTLLSARMWDGRVGTTVKINRSGLIDPAFKEIQVFNSYPLFYTVPGGASCKQVDTLGMFQRADGSLISLTFEGKETCDSLRKQQPQFVVRQFQPDGVKASELVVDVKDGSAGGVPWEFASLVRNPTVDGTAAIFLPTVLDAKSGQKLASATVTRVLIADDIAAPRAEGAWWAGEAENGWGFSLVQSGNTLAAGWYYYDDAGKPTWAIMPGCTWDASYNICSGQVTTATGSWLGNYDASKYTPTTIGSAMLRFNGAGAAVFEWDIGGKRAQKSISRLTFGGGVAPSTTNYSGVWSGGTSQNGWGLALFQQQATIAGAWYTFDNAGKAVWYLLNGGSWSADGSYVAPLVRATGSPLIGATYNPALFKPETAGTLTLRFAADGTAAMTYTVDGVTQTKQITKLAF